MVQKFTGIDIGLIKLSVMAFTIWVLMQFPFINNWLQHYNPWIFFVFFIVLSIRPIWRFFARKEK